MVVQNICVTLGALGGAWCWTKAFSILQQRKKLKRDTVRKIIHLTAAPLMMVTWPMYTTAWHARMFASLLPITFGARMIRSSKNDPLCQSVSRSGDHIESRFGPGCYCVSIATIILTFWRSSPVTYITLGMIVFGDAFANIVGSAVKGPRWPISQSEKSIAGSLGFVVAGSSASMLFLKFAELTRMCVHTQSRGQVLIVAVFGAVAEAVLPIDDNLSVPAVSAFIAKLLL